MPLPSSGTRMSWQQKLVSPLAAAVDSTTVYMRIIWLTDIIYSNSFAYAAAVVAAYGCHCFILHESA
jgi:hypothetical protein